VGTTERGNYTLHLLGVNGGHLHYPADEARDRSYMGVLPRPYGVFCDSEKTWQAVFTNEMLMPAHSMSALVDTSSSVLPRASAPLPGAMSAPIRGPTQYVDLRAP